MLKIEGDRRHHPRTEIQRPCKIFDSRTGKYLAASTRDLSSAGLLIDVPRVLAVKPGDTLHLGVAMTRRQGLLPAKGMIAVRVVRALATVDDHTHLAVSLDPPNTEFSSVALQTAA
jgi:hypothetical protein